MRLLFLLTLLVGCAAPPTATQQAPPTPTLATTDTPTPQPRFVLRGDAPEALVVRLTVDRACEGPVLLELTPAELASGVTMELVVGNNVFTAQSISPAGARSSCSAPLEVSRFVPPSPEPLRNVVVSPGTSAATRTFTIKGIAPAETTVRLHADSCFGDVLQTLTPAQFETDGFTYTTERDGFFMIALDAIDVVGQRTTCNTMSLWSKTAPPWATFDYGSPQPTPESSAWFVASGDFRDLEVWSEPGCQGIALTRCQLTNISCVFNVQQANASWMGPFSAHLTDFLGNESCVLGLPFAYDVNASTAPGLVVRNDAVHALVHSGRDRLELYASSDCTGVPFANLEVRTALGRGLVSTFAIDGGVVTARSFVAQTTPDPCSLPLSVP